MLKTTMKKKEPGLLKRGKQFHRSVQGDWKITAQGVVTLEAGIKKPGGRNGRIDILVDRGESLAAVVEIKASDWDAMSEAALRRNVQRYARQIEKYVESQLANGSDVSPGVIFRARPSSAERLKLIESLFDTHAISVVWQDESIEECRARNLGESSQK